MGSEFWNEIILKAQYTSVVHSKIPIQKYLSINKSYKTIAYTNTFTPNILSECKQFKLYYRILQLIKIQTTR